MAVSATHGVTTTVIATAAITRKRFVTHAGAHTNITKSLGVSIHDIASTEPCAVVVDGTAAVIAGAALAVGAAVTSDATGKAVAAGANPINGYVMIASAADGDEILVELV